MKILLLWPFFYPHGKKGVACAIRGEAFAKYLSKEGAEVSVIVPEKKGVSTETIDYEGCMVYRSKTYDTTGELYPFFFSLLYLPVSIFLLWIKAKKIRPDLIIVSNPGVFLPLEGSIIAKLLKVPYIFDVQDSLIEIENFEINRLKFCIKKYIEYTIGKYANLIFTVTPTLKNMLVEEYSINPQKLKTIYNGVDLNEFTYHVKNEKYDFIHLGSPRYYYDTISLIDAFSKVVIHFPNVELRFVGVEDNSYTNRVRQHVIDLGLSNNIKFIEDIPHEKIPHELAKAKVGIHTFIQDKVFRCAIGVKIFEYMAAGLPIAHLGPSESEIETLIKKNNIGIFSDSPDDFAKKSIFLLENNKIREVMGINALKTIQEYDWSKTVKRMYKNYLLSTVKSHPKKRL